MDPSSGHQERLASRITYLDKGWGIKVQLVSSPDFLSSLVQRPRMPGSDTNSSSEDKADYLDDKVQFAFSKRDVDTAAELAAGSDEPLNPTDALRVR